MCSEASTALPSKSATKAPRSGSNSSIAAGCRNGISRRRACLLGAGAAAAAWSAPPPVAGPDLLLRLDLRSGSVRNLLGQGSPTAAGILPGSLLKPFTALAYAASHGGRMLPPVRCEGCWGGRAHGEVDLVAALSLSCNRYFEELSLRVPHEQMVLTAAEYGLGTVPPDDVKARIGLGTSWRIAPADLLAAYARLREPAIVQGLRQCARSGTARAVGAGSLAKTGTAACDHPRHPMPGDGLAIALWPAESPVTALLVREHGIPGARAAARLKEHLRP